MGRQWPSAVVNAQRALGALVGLMAVATLLTWLLEDDLIEAWAQRNEAAREVLAEGGVDALRASTISLPAFVPVVVVMFVVLVCLLAVLRVFFREGYAWARLALAAVAVLIGLCAGLIAFREDPPAVFVVLCLLALVADLALVGLLFHPDTSAFIRGAWLVHHDEADASV